MGKIYILGSASQFGMERSYKKALESLNYEVEIFDFNQCVNSYIPYKFFQKLGAYIDFNSAIVKANHFISKKFFLEKPHAIIIFTHVKIYPGTLEYFKSICKNVIFYWPDSIVNMNNNIFNNLRHYHIIYTHSLENVRIFQKNGLKSEWLPFAGDVLSTINYDAFQTHHPEYDFSFIGSYRPERYEAVNILLENFSQSKFLIVGNGWEKLKFNNKNLIIVDKMVNLNDFLHLTSKSKISLNAIDYLNYPSSNLRFFEIGLSGIPQLSSFVPEFEDKFKDFEDVFYFKDQSELVEKAQWVFDNYDNALTSAKSFRKKIDRSDNYLLRVQYIAENFVS